MTTDHELDPQAIADSFKAQIRRVKELEAAKIELLGHLKWIVKQYEGDGMEGMYIRETVIYETTEKLISKYK